MTLDKTDWLAIVCIVIPGIFLIAGMFWAGGKIAERITECEQRNGVLVKAAEGHVCVDRSVLK